MIMRGGKKMRNKEYGKRCLYSAVTGLLFLAALMIAPAAYAGAAPEEECRHEHTEVRDAAEPTCREEGATGDIYCLDCDSIVEYSQPIPALPHTVPEREHVVAVSCTRDGYTGDGVCSVCGLPVEGEIIPMLDHTYDSDRVCTKCGWMTPGLYLENQLAMTWDELEEAGYVTYIKDTKDCLDTVTGLKGCLVISEDISFLDDNSFKNSEISEAWIPRTVHQIPPGAFRDTMIEKVRTFGFLTEVGQSAFNNLSGLKSVEFLNPVENIGQYAFTSCSSLEGVNLPAGLLTLGGDAFSRCSSLKQIELPEGLTSIGKACFASSGLTSITIPSTVTYIGSEICKDCQDLRSADFSACPIEELWSNFGGCVSLTEYRLPVGLKALHDEFFECGSMTDLVLPDGLKEIRLPLYNNVETVVWPESLIDAKGFNNAEHLTTVNYRGSALKWELISNKGEWADRVTVNFDYQGTEEPAEPVEVSGAAEKAEEFEAAEKAEEPELAETAEEPEPAESEETAGPEIAPEEAVPGEEKEEEDTWTCENGHEGNTGNFCVECGAPKPVPPEMPEEEGETWTCENGHEGNTGNFCPECGAPKPAA